MMEKYKKEKIKYHNLATLGASSKLFYFQAKLLLYSLSILCSKIKIKTIKKITPTKSFKTSLIFNSPTLN
jgi:hypothetical protein